MGRPCLPISTMPMIICSVQLRLKGYSSKMLNIQEDIMMLENYGFSPLEITPKDGFWSFYFENNNETLTISFNTFERWVKVIVGMAGNRSYVEMLIEKATSLRLDGSVSENQYLIGEGENDMVFTLQFKPKIKLSFTANDNR